MSRTVDMIEVTPRARRLAATYSKDHQQRPIRIFVKMGGCGIRSLGVALENPTQADDVFEIGDHIFIIDKKLLKKIHPVKVDADSICFRLSGSGLHPPSGCGTCPYLCGAKGGKRCSGVCATCQDQCATGQRLKARKNRLKKIA